jgi:hypothetical protein
MKKIALFVVLFFQTVLLAAQAYVDGVELTPSNTGQYIEVNSKFNANGSCVIEVDYGQRRPKEDYLTDEKNNRQEFDSFVHALNFLYQNGWKVAEISVSNERGRLVLMERRF